MSQPPITTEKVKFNKGTSADALTTKQAVDIPSTTKTVAEVRKILASQSFMSSTDVFLLPPDNYMLAKADEAKTAWSTLQSGVEKTIGILVTKSTDPQQGTTNLNLPTLPTKPEFWDTSIGGPGGGIQLPQSAVAQANGEDMVKNAADLDMDEWIYLIRANNLLKGLVMGTGLASDDPGPQVSGINVIQPPTKIGWSVDDKAGVEIRTVYTERSTTYVRSGWTKAAANVTSPYAAASVEASHMESSAQSSTQKMTYVTGAYNFPRCTLEFNKKDIKLSDDFLRDLDSALEYPDNKDKKAALTELFNTYGHVFARRVTLGGLLVTTTSETTSSNEERLRVENSVSASLQAVVAGTGGGGASISAGEATDKSNINKSGSSVKTYSAIGGNTLFVTNIDKWIPTIAPYQNWRIVRTDQVVPLIDLLSPSDPRRKIINDLAPSFKPLRGKWVDVVEMFNDSGSRAKQGLHVYRPLIPTGTALPWYWLGQTLDGRKGLIVQEVIPGSLCPVKETQRVWDLKDTKGIQRDLYLGNPTPLDNSSYVMMGSFFYNIPMQGNPPPPLDQNYYPQLRAIHQRLLSKGRFGDTPNWSDQGSGGKKQGSIWQIYRADDATGIPTVSMAQFYATAGYGKPAKDVYCIKADAIDIIEFGS